MLSEIDALQSNDLKMNIIIVFQKQAGEFHFFSIGFPGARVCVSHSGECHQDENGSRLGLAGNGLGHSGKNRVILIFSNPCGVRTGR